MILCVFLEQPITNERPCGTVYFRELELLVQMLTEVKVIGR